jgi:lipopolysaccharide export system permease protein
VIRLHERYIFSSFIAALTIALVGFVIIFLVVDLFEKIDTYVDHDAKAASIVKYSVYKTPQIVTTVLPVAMLLGCLFGIGNLTRRNELLPLQNAGLSQNRILAPVYFAGLIISGAAFAAGETIVPRANEELERVWRTEIRGEPSDPGQLRTNVNYLGEGGRYFLIGRYDARRQMMHDVVVETFASNTLVERLDAKEAVWIGGRWEFRNGFLRRFVDDREEAEPFRTTTLVGLMETPEDFAKPAKNAEEMSHAELRRLVRKTRASGGAATREEVEMHMKISFPFSNVVLILLGSQLAARRRRSGLAVSFAVTIGIAFVYYGAIRIGEALGINDTIPPLTAAWLGNAVFGAVAAVTVARGRG